MNPYSISIWTSTQPTNDEKTQIASYQLQVNEITTNDEKGEHVIRRYRYTFEGAHTFNELEIASAHRHEQGWNIINDTQRLEIRVVPWTQTGTRTAKYLFR